MVCSETTTSLKKYQLSGKFRRKSTRACSFNNNDSNNDLSAYPSKKNYDYCDESAKFLKY